MSYTKLFIHAILVVKDRRPLITDEMEKGLYDQITKQVEKCESKVLAINGCPDHVHLLISMSSKIAFSDLTKQLKGATSYWINAGDLLNEKFSWQKGPRGFSVSQSRIKQTITYIQNQKIKHQKLSFAEEFKEILKVHSLVE